MELDPHVLRAEVHVGLGVGEQRHHAGVRDGDPLGPAGRSGGVDDVGGVVPAHLGLGGVPRRQFVALHEHPGRDACPGQQLREAVALLTVHQDDLGCGVGEDVLQPVVRVGEVQRDVGAARADDGDQGDDLFQGARDGHGDPLARPGPGRAQGGGQFVLGVGQFAVGQGPGAAVEAALGDGGGGGVAARGGVEQAAQRRRGDRCGTPLALGCQVGDQGVRPGEQAGEGVGERVQDRLCGCLPQQFAVVDQVEARPSVERALDHQRERVVRGALVDEVGDDQRVVGSSQGGDIGRHVEDDEGVEQGAGAGLAADPRQGDVLVRQYRALVLAYRGEQVGGGGSIGPTGAYRDGVDEQAHHVPDAGHLGVAA